MSQIGLISLMGDKANEPDRPDVPWRIRLIRLIGLIL